MHIEEIKEVLNLKTIPETFIKYEQSISLKKSVITKKELETAFKFYGYQHGDYKCIGYLYPH